MTRRPPRQLRPLRPRVRPLMIEGAICAAVIAAHRGDSPRYAATNYSLPGPLGRSRLNGPERSIVERLLRTGFGDYTRYRPNVHGNDAADYINVGPLTERSTR